MKFKILMNGHFQNKIKGKLFTKNLISKLGLAIDS